MNQLIKTTLPLIFLACTGLAQAGDESGLYIGGSVANAYIDNSEDGVKFDDSSAGFKFFAGYNFGIIPLLDLGVEASYVNFGSLDSDRRNDVDSKLSPTAWDAFGVVGLTLGPVGLFAKAGVSAWSMEVDNKNAPDSSQSGNDAAYGVGAKLQLDSLGVAVRAEYEYFEFDNADIDYYSVGVVYTF